MKLSRVRAGVMRNPKTLQDQVLEIGTRLKSPPSTLLIDSVFAFELAHQEHLFSAIGLADIAHTLIAIEKNTIPKPEGGELLANLLELQSKPDSFVSIPANGDIYTNREAWLAERTPAVGWLGIGRARREATTTAFVLVMRQLVVDLTETLIALAYQLTRQANTHKLSIMPDYTYLQAAQPTSFGHYLLGFVYPLLRDLERLELLLSQLNCSPMGCGSTNGSRLAQGREQLADLLGFSKPIPHARDAMWQADLPIECAAILTSSIINLSRLAEDLQIYSTQEFALVELNDSHARASKIMPQKKNPFALTHIRGVANKMLGVLTTIAATARTPSGQPDNRLSVYGDLPEATLMVKNAVALMTEVLEQLMFNQPRALELVESGWTMATDLSETLVQKCGLDFRSAHQLVAFLVSAYPGKSALALTVETLNQAAKIVLGQSLVITKAQLKTALDPYQALQVRTEIGGTATESMDSMIADCRVQLAKFSTKTQANENHFKTKQIELINRASNASSADTGHRP